MNRLKGKIAVIAGASTAVGSHTARAFAAEGAALLLADRDESGAVKLAEEIRGNGGRSAAVGLDVTVVDSWQNAMTLAENFYGGVDVLVNCDQETTAMPIEAATATDWDRIMNINVKGSLLGVQAAIPPMRRRGGGSIVFLSSTAAISPSLGTSELYAASAGAIKMLAKDLVSQYSAEGIRFNSVHVGALQPTDQEHRRSRGFAEVRNPIPLGRHATAVDVANAILFVASDESSYITGLELLVDGGIVAT